MSPFITISLLGCYASQCYNIRNLRKITLHLPPIIGGVSSFYLHYNNPNPPNSEQMFFFFFFFLFSVAFSLFFNFCDLGKVVIIQKKI